MDPGIEARGEQIGQRRPGQGRDRGDKCERQDDGQISREDRPEQELSDTRDAEDRFDENRSADQPWDEKTEQGQERRSLEEVFRDLVSGNQVDAKIAAS